MLLKDVSPIIKSLAIEFNVGIRTIQKDVYQRLGQFEIEKDTSGYLKFGDNFSLSCINEMIKAS